MWQSGAVLLISSYELGHQPMGLAIPLALLEQAGYRPAVLDLAVEDFSAEKATRARFVGISVPMYTALRLGIRVAERVRRINPGCHICFYGLYASLNAPALFEGPADSVVGEDHGEKLLSQVRAVERGDPRRGFPAALRRAALYPHVAVSPRPRVCPPPTAHCPPLTAMRRLQFPIPSRAPLPSLHRYAQLEEGDARRLAGYVEATRGCLHHCLHCPIPSVYGGRLVVVPHEVILADIRQQVAAGATHITFGDPDFFNGPAHSLRIVRSMRREFSGLTFDFTAKVEHLLMHRRLLPELRALGCLFVISAVESLSDRVLAVFEKRHTRADVADAVRIVRDAGISLRPTWLPFTPWSTMQDYREMLEFIWREGLVEQVDPVQYGLRLLIPPGSGLLGRSTIRAFLKKSNPALFGYRWEHPDPRMDDLQRQVSILVEQGSFSGLAAPEIFRRIYRLVCKVSGRAGKRISETVWQSRAARAPRLTESWFC